ncbi:MAG: IS4 family transposase, partial [Candidatus Rokuibacteriota bacterium]
RQKLPLSVCRGMSQEILQRLRQIVSRESGLPSPVFLLDGSALELEHSRELVRTYPPAENQHGHGHWPVLRIVVLHDLETGLAQEPCWGPMYGAHAVGEQELAEKAMEALPADAVVMGDGNFGIFSIAYAAQQRNFGVLLRLTKVRAQKIRGGPLPIAGDYPLSWQASRWDGRNREDGGWPSGAEVDGRLIVARVGRGKSKQWLYLFTTLAWPVEELVALYGRRWNIETDLRSLKRTVGLHHVAVKSQDMLEKELLMAMAAYNLVRAVMCLAARRHNLDPRQLSFTQVLNVVNCAWPKLIAAPTREEHDREFERVLDLAAQSKLPKRRNRRSYPRAVWRRPLGFPFRKERKSK